MFFDFDQNNSGGGFDFDAEAGITHHVIIEADSAEEANERARELGLYFDGVENGPDCDCCGDRWYEAHGEGDDVPTVYGTPVTEYEALMLWAPKGTPEIFIHYADGRIEGVKPPKRTTL
jgi:hypothetical protein